MTRSRKLTKTIHLSRFSIDSILRKAADMFADHFSDVYLKDELLTATWRSMTISMREIHDKPNNPPAMSATTGPSRTSQPIAKILDNIVADVLFERFKDTIAPQQHGFFKNRSIVTNLVDYTDMLQRSVEKADECYAS